MKNISRLHPLNNWFQTFIIIFVIATFSFLFFYYPVALDDYRFLDGINSYASTQNPKSTLFGLWAKAIETYRFDNARLSNTLGLFMLVIPRWIPATITVIAFSISYLLVISLSRAHTPLWFSLASLLLCTVLPWHDNMFITMYSMNYVWTAPWMLLSIYLFIYRQKHPLWLAILTGIITGLSHEGFAVPTIGGLVLFLLIKRQKPNTIQSTLIISLFIGVLWLLLAPSLFARGSSFINDGTAFARLNAFATEWPFFIYAAFWGCCFLKKNLRHKTMQPIPLICLLIGISTIPLHLFCYAMRATFPMVLCAIIGGIWLAQSVWEHIGNAVSISITLVASLFMVCHMVVACHYVFILHNEMEQLNTELARSPKVKTTIYTPLRYDYQTPWFTLCKSNHRLKGWILTDQAGCFGTAEHTIVPAALKDYKGQYDSIIPGNAKAKLYDGYIICTLDGNLKNIEPSRFNIIFSGNNHEFYYVRFAGGDGKDYLLLIPHAKISDISRNVQKVWYE